jgi:hypothetical protein
MIILIAIDSIDLVLLSGTVRELQAPNSCFAIAVHDDQKDGLLSTPPDNDSLEFLKSLFSLKAWKNGPVDRTFSWFMHIYGWQTAGTHSQLYKVKVKGCP